MKRYVCIRKCYHTYFPKGANPRTDRPIGGLYDVGEEAMFEEGEAPRHFVLAEEYRAAKEKGALPDTLYGMAGRKAEPLKAPLRTDFEAPPKKKESESPPKKGEKEKGDADRKDALGR